jgi:hypothetical protein
MPSPSLSVAQEKSPPASASFDGAGTEGFTYSPMLNASPMSVSVEAEAQVTTVGTLLSTSTFIDVITNLAEGRAVLLQLVPGLGGAYTARVEELMGEPDGGIAVASHTLSGSLSASNNWHDVKLVIEMQTIAVTVDGVPTSFMRSQPEGTSTTPTFIIGFDSSWSGFLDNVVIDAL